jgi:transglutaminase-like putative cysteine protease
MKYLSDDLVQYLRSNKLGQRQKALIRELASACRQDYTGIADYANQYVRRSLKIYDSISGSIKTSQ